MKMIEEEIPGIYIHSLKIGDNAMEDTMNGFFMPIAEQVLYTLMGYIAFILYI